MVARAQPGDLRHSLADSSWKPSFLEASLPPFFLVLQDIEKSQLYTLPQPPGMLCQSTVFLSHMEELAGAFWHDDQGSS